jgi:hypothetical protein
MNETQTTEWLVESAQYSAVVKIESDLYDVNNYDEKRIVALEAMTLAMAGWLEKTTAQEQSLVNFSVIIGARLHDEDVEECFYTQTASIAYNLSVPILGDEYRVLFDATDKEENFLSLMNDIGTCIGLREIDAFIDEKCKKYHK